MVLSESAVFSFEMKIKIPIQIIELEETNFHILVSATFEDGIAGNWIIDTGASKTVFDENLAKYYSDIGKSEDLFSAGTDQQPFKSSLAILRYVKFGELKIDNLKVALLNLNHINALYQKSNHTQICGLLGGDFFMKYRAEINYKKKLLILRF